MALIVQQIYKILGLDLLFGYSSLAFAFIDKKQAVYVQLF